MIQIRDNTFETNSSSSHSLIITDFDGKYTPEEMMRGIYLWDDKKKSLVMLSRLHMGIQLMKLKIFGINISLILMALSLI